MTYPSDPKDIAARGYVADNLSFSAPLASYDKARPYFEEMERLRIRFDIKRVFSDGSDVCLLYDFSSGPLTMCGAGWYRVENGKISSLKVIYDPRPIIEMLAKK